MQTIRADDLEAAQRTVYAAMAPTPQYAWPLLRERLGWRGRSVGVTLCGGNVDRALFARVLAGEDGRAW